MAESKFENVEASQDESKQNASEDSAAKEDSTSVHHVGNKNWIEWSVFGVSAVLVLGLIGTLGYQAATHEESPPQLKATVLESRLSDQETSAFKIAIENRGTTTAHSVEVEVVWPRTNQRVGFTLDHVPRHGKRSGWAVFERDKGALPRREELQAHVLGFQE